MIAELAHNDFGNQAWPGNTTGDRPGWKGSCRDPILATTAGILGPHMDVSLQLGRLVFQLPRDVLTDAFQRATTTRAVPLVFRDVVLMDNLWQFVPVDLSFWTTTPMAGNFNFVGYKDRIFLVAGESSSNKWP